MNEGNKQKFIGLFAMLQDAEIYEPTLDTLVEWFGGVVPEETYKKLREGTLYFVFIVLVN